MSITFSLIKSVKSKIKKRFDECVYIVGKRQAGEMLQIQIIMNQFET